MKKIVFGVLVIVLFPLILSAQSFDRSEYHGKIISSTKQEVTWRDDNANRRDLEVVTTIEFSEDKVTIGEDVFIIKSKEFDGIDKTTFILVKDDESYTLKFIPEIFISLVGDNNFDFEVLYRQVQEQ